MKIIENLSDKDTKHITIVPCECWGEKGDWSYVGYCNLDKTYMMANVVSRKVRLRNLLSHKCKLCGRFLCYRKIKNNK